MLTGIYGKPILRLDMKRSYLPRSECWIISQLVYIGHKMMNYDISLRFGRGRCISIMFDLVHQPKLTHSSDSCVTFPFLFPYHSTTHCFQVLTLPSNRPSPSVPPYPPNLHSPSVPLLPSSLLSLPNPLSIKSN
jgi:hypothetical protein